MIEEPLTGKSVPATHRAGDAMIDRYSKVVLTVIAGALVAIAAQLSVHRALAVGSECGRDQLHACYVLGVGPHGEMLVTF